jgi:antitoxin CptB
LRAADAPPPALRFRARRGMKELDVLFERYLARHYARAPAAERERFARLLEREDPELWSWLLGGQAPPPDFVDVVERIRSHA